LNNHPFLDYAARHWGHHARRHQESIKRLALEFLRDDSKVACASQVMLQSGWITSFKLLSARSFSAFHILAFFGLKQIFRDQLEKGGDANSKDAHGQTPLSLAAEKGHEGVVKLLLARSDIQVDSKDTSFGRTPLLLAAKKGHEGIVKLLLARNDIQVDSKDRYGRTALSFASEKGHEGVVKLLLAHSNIQLDSKKDFHRTPLLLASKNGHEGIVRLLRRYLRDHEC
jgi:ankyrin repeat protein